MKALVVFLFLFLTVAVSAQERTGIVTAEHASLRATPSAKGTVIATLGKDDQFKIIRQSGSWYRVRVNKHVGWLPRNAIAIAELRMEEIVRISPEPPVQSDAEMKSIIENELLKMGIYGVNVEVKNAEVTLTGAVEKDRLAEVMKAAQEAEIRKVYNKLTVK